MRHLLICLGLLVLTPYALTGQQGDCPYPVIFLHGWTGNQTSFSSVYNNSDFSAVWGGLSDTYHAVLNATTNTNIWGADGIPNTSDDDVLIQFNNEGNNLQPGCVYAINFENFWNENPANPLLLQNSGATPNLVESDSNEAAILKQGYALGQMIAKVLAANPGKEKVILVAHSMGGLEAREYLQRRTPENATGTPRWWVNPGSPEGHAVAKLVTAVTPHRGSNTLGNFFTEDDPSRDALPDLASEAVRDMRYSYACGFLLLDDCPGVYLFGGDEDDFSVFPYPFWNEDVDCDGDETSPAVVGINIDGTTQGFGDEWQGTYDNPNLPLPTNVRYTWITSDISVDFGDGVVAWDRQWLYNGSTPMPSDGTPYRLSDTLHSDLFHTSVNDDVDLMVRGMDEGDYPFFAWKVNPDIQIAAMAQRRSNNAPETPLHRDPDWFKFLLPGSITTDLDIQLTPHPALSGRIDFFTSAPGDYTGMGTTGSHSQVFSAGGGQTNLTIPLSQLSPGATYYFRITHSGVQSWHWKSPYTFTIETVQPLPLEWLDIEARLENRQGIIEWSTVWEEDVEYFSVQRSADGIHFTEIGRLAGHEESFEVNTYQWVDPAPVPGKNLYRIQSVDLDGQYQYSEIVLLQLESPFQLSQMYPNPVSDRLYLEYVNGIRKTIHLSIWNTLGQQVYNTEIPASIGQDVFTLELNDLASGWYLLRLEQAGYHQSVKIFKK
jgi:pimeloyl-ACP methyl ester carboxylesterase